MLQSFEKGFRQGLSEGSAIGSIEGKLPFLKSIQSRKSPLANRLINFFYGGESHWRGIPPVVTDIKINEVITLHRRSSPSTNEALSQPWTIADLEDHLKKVSSLPSSRIK